VSRAGRVALAGTLALVACTKSAPAPRVVAEARRADLGKLWIGEERTHGFSVKNDGDAPLTFGEVRSSCGCLLADFDHADVKPGEAREIAVKFAADKSLGVVEKELRVATNDPATPWLAFTLAADVSALYVFTPPAAVWKELVLGEPATQQVQIAVADGAAVRFGAPQLDEPGFTAALVATSTAEPPVVEVRFDNRAKVGTHLFHVVVPGDHSRVAQARVPVEATVRARLDFPEGDRVDFGEVAATRGATVTRRVRVRVRGAAPLAVDHPEAKVVAKTALDARWHVVEQGRAWTLELVIPPTLPAATLVGRVDVTLPGTDEPVHSLTLAGRIVAR